MLRNHSVLIAWGMIEEFFPLFVFVLFCFVLFCFFLGGEGESHGLQRGMERGSGITMKSTKGEYKI